MPFTTKEIVKNHILDHHLGAANIVNEPLQLVGGDSAQLSRGMILQSSEKVKARESNQPAIQEISFASGDTVVLMHPKLIPESVVVASDSSLGQIYVENIDYHIDYDTGSIRRLATGAIPSGGSVAIWYFYHRIYQRSVDYSIDYQKGTIKRYNTGAIESGQWVLIDYTVEYGNLDDAAIENAITEANGQLISFIDEAYSDSADRSLVTAETYLAVAIICRIRAMESISPSRNGNVKGPEAQSWSAISEQYRREAYNILSRFAAALGSFKSPSKA